MEVVADLQLHSKYSRAVSPQMTIPFIAQWAAKKGIGLVATGDWTHPLWFREIQVNLEELGNGLLKIKNGKLEVGSKKLDHDVGSGIENTLFLLATEVSSIYSQGGKSRRVHTLIWVPSLSGAEKINEALRRRGCNLMADGRPIIGLSCIEVADLVLNIEPKALIIPAHCLHPESMILTKGFFPKQIQSISQGELVLTHSGNFQKVTEVKKREYTGDSIIIKPWYFRPGLTTTPEHPYYAIQTIKKCPSTGDICRPSKAHLELCRSKACLSYKPRWILARDLEIGDVLVYPRPKRKTVSKMINLSRDLKGFRLQDGVLDAGGTRGRKVSDALLITSKLGRLIGYYIAEGTTDGRNTFSFTFSDDETEYIKDLVHLIKNVFGLEKPRVYRRFRTKGVEIGFSSKIHAAWLANVCYLNPGRRKASEKKLPEFLFDAEPRAQAEFLRGWYRGDKGYTSSRVLMNNIKTLCLQIGMIPSVIVDTAQSHARRGNHQFGKRIIQARSDSFVFSTFAFFEDPFDLKKDIPRSQTKINRRHGWIDENNVYLPIKDILWAPYSGEVYNLEVEHDHSYVSEFAVVHNCWTPWFSVFGGMSGFDSLEEAFGKFAKNVYAIETGLSSNPAMNWRIKELDNRSILSFSDAHSGPKLGREATVFKRKKEEGRRKKEEGNQQFSYDDVYGAIAEQALGKNDGNLEIGYTVEFYPEEGKYHYSGHRNCGVSFGPEETAKNKGICPVCGRSLTQGVMQRVEELAGRTEEDLKISEIINHESDIRMIMSKTFPNRPTFAMLVPLLEIIAEAIGSPVSSPKVLLVYENLITTFGGEFAVLLSTSIDEIKRIGGERVAEGIDKVRRGNIEINPGYDGVFGRVKIWKEGVSTEDNKEQLALF